MKQLRGVTDPDWLHAGPQPRGQALKVMSRLQRAWPPRTSWRALEPYKEHALQDRHTRACSTNGSRTCAALSLIENPSSVLNTRMCSMSLLRAGSLRLGT